MEKIFFNDSSGTLIFEDTNDIVFSNGISFYILNKGLVNITSPRIVKNMTNYGIHYEHRIQKMSMDRKDKLLNKVESLKNNLTEIQYAECVDKVVTRLTSFIYYPNEIEFDFKTSELNTAEILLDNPELKMNTNYPLLYGENDNGKVYILGYKYND